MGDDVDTKDKVIGLPGSDYLPGAVRQEMERMAREAKTEPPPDAARVVRLAASHVEAAMPRPGKAPAEPAPEGDETPVSPEMLAPLPRAGDPYKAHARLANGPLLSIFFLGKGQLPDGFSYSNLERVRMAAPDVTGVGPMLMLRFTGSETTEVRVEGRNMLGLCDLIGRHLIHWLREHPTGRDDGNDQAVFIRSITPRVIER